MVTPVGVATATAPTATGWLAPALTTRSEDALDVLVDQEPLGLGVLLGGAAQTRVDELELVLPRLAVELERHIRPLLLARRGLQRARPIAGRGRRTRRARLR